MTAVRDVEGGEGVLFPQLEDQVADLGMGLVVPRAQGLVKAENPRAGGQGPEQGLLLSLREQNVLRRGCKK